MPRPKTDQIVTQDKKRFYYQMDGACPGNPIQYSGVDGQYMNIEDVTNPVRSIDTISVGDPKRAGRFRRIARNRSAVDYPSATVQLLQKRGYFPAQFGEFRTKVVTFYELVGDTADLSDFLGGWSEYVRVYSYGEVEEPTEGGGSWDAGEQVQDELDFTFEAVYSLGKLGFAEEAAVEVYSEVVDVCYGTLNDGYTAAYAVTNNVVASAGQAPSLTYRTKKNGAWTSAAIDGSASTDVPQGIAIIGKYLIVLFDDGATGGYFYASLNKDSGVPGTFAKVTTGFVSGGAPVDLFSPNTRTTYFCGDGGYIYKLASVSGGVTVMDAGVVSGGSDLTRIDGSEDGTLVCVGAGSLVVYSEDRGVSWTSVGTVSSGNGTALAVLGDTLWWIGLSDGEIWYTTDRGSSWTQKTIDSTMAAIQDIVFPTDEVVFVLATTSAPAALLWTSYNGGEDWTNDRDRLLSIPTADRFNRLRSPEETEPNILANWGIICGLAGNGTDGVIFEMAPKRLVP